MNKKSATIAMLMVGLMSTNVQPAQVQGATNQVVSSTTKSSYIKALNKNMYAKKSVNVYSKTSTKGKKLGTLKLAQAVKVTGQDKSNGWYRIKFNGKTGYVSSSSLSTSKPSTSTIKKLNKTMYAKQAVNVRSKSNSNSKKLGTLRYGQAVKVTGQDTKTGWYRIQYKGKVGYVSSSYLSSKKPSTTSSSITKMNKVLYATTAVNVRNKSNSSGKKLGTLSYGKKVTVTGQDKKTGWYRIKFNGKTGYVSSSYLSTKKPSSSSSSSKKPSSSSSSNKGSSSSDKIPEYVDCDYTDESWSDSKYTNGNGGW